MSSTVLRAVLIKQYTWFNSKVAYQYPHLPKRLWGHSYKVVAGCSTQPVWTSHLVQQGFLEARMPMTRRGYNLHIILSMKTIVFSHSARKLPLWEICGCSSMVEHQSRVRQQPFNLVCCGFESHRLLHGSMFNTFSQKTM